MTSTANLSIPEIDPNQTGKTVTMNQALVSLDQAMSDLLLVDASLHATPYTIPYSDAADEPAAVKTALRFLKLSVTGALTGTWTAYMPSGHKKLFYVANNTSGGHSIVVKVSGQTGVTIAAGSAGLCYLNGTDVEAVSPALALASLTDVSITAPSNGQSLVYDSVAGKWKNQSASGTLAGLSDVLISGPTNGQVLTYNSGAAKWENAAGGGGGGTGLFGGIMSSTPTIAGTGFTSWDNQNGASVSDTAIGIELKAGTSNGGSNGLNVRYKTAPSSPYVASALFLINPVAQSTNYGIGFGWRDSVSGHLQTHNLLSQVAANIALLVSNWNPANTQVGTPATTIQQFVSPYFWLQIEDDGTNAIFRYSYNGVTWWLLYTVAQSAGFLGTGGYNQIAFATNPYAELLSVTLASYTD